MRSKANRVTGVTMRTCLLNPYSCSVGSYSKAADKIGSAGINIGTETDVAVDIDSSTLDIDASGAITIDGTSTLSIDAADDSNVTVTGSGKDLDIADHADWADACFLQRLK